MTCIFYSKIVYFKGTLSGRRQFLATESSLKMMKNVFYFNLKVLFVNISIFVLTLVMLKNGLIRKIRLISKFMLPQPRKQTIAIHILPNIPRSKGNQTMKIDQLIEYTMRNIFVEKSYAKYAGEIITKPLSKKTKLSISYDQ